VMRLNEEIVFIIQFSWLFSISNYVACLIAFNFIIMILIIWINRRASRASKWKRNKLFPTYIRTNGLYENVILYSRNILKSRVQNTLNQSPMFYCSYIYTCLFIKIRMHCDNTYGKMHIFGTRTDMKPVARGLFLNIAHMYLLWW
jgi:hypothetical protein